MDLVRLWAGVRFLACNGDPEGLLTLAAAQGLHLSEVIPRPGGFSACCAAWHYLPLSALARRKRVCLRVEKRSGLFFCLRPLLRRTGLWLGLAVFVPLLLWSQSLVWAIDAAELTRGQQARAVQILREAVGLGPGAYVDEAGLKAGEYALLQSGEFSWASLNFDKGRLCIEAAAAKPVPEIASGTLHGLRAKTAGTIVSTNLVSGTMLVAPNQTVEQGQGLIGTARSERDGTLIFEPAAGSVRARFAWTTEEVEPFTRSVTTLTGETAVSYRLTAAGHSLALPFAVLPSWQPAVQISRHVQPALFGLCLPLSVEEVTLYREQTQTVALTEDDAIALARLRSLQKLHAAYPDAEIIARSETAAVADDVLRCTFTYTVIADICT